MSVPETRKSLHSNALELWGGVECTVNRVGSHWHDQLARNGHEDREADLEAFASLGITAIRYPVLWERIAPDDIKQLDWSWTDRRLPKLKQLGIRPIAGLLHHGSGPGYTSLISDNFPDLAARFAEQVAQRYPWLTDYTPVNEPLTTARFSGLYGHWYPHERTDQAFVTALLNQCRAIALSMSAIRQVNPQARLIQTEDLGFIHSTPTLAYQARFENDRRWLSLDLLCGMVDARHPLWKYLRNSGASETELAWFRDHPCPPNVAGFNYYLTSERFLDERLTRYPACTHGSNKRHRYADVEAVRVRDDGILGLGPLLREGWERYRLPLAITEVHLGCHRESQLRWLYDAWKTAKELNGECVPVVAVTAWSLLGSFDWNSLCTRQDGRYEPGVFDVRNGTPRPTAIAKALRTLADTSVSEHPAVEPVGWWQQDCRLLFRSEATALDAPCASPAHRRAAHRPILIVGGTGVLGQAFAWACRERRLAHLSLSRTELDITRSASIEAALREYRPWAVINAAGFTRVDSAEVRPSECELVNTLGPEQLAIACAAANTRLVTFSSDLVFEGERQVPYLEPDATGPLSAYGRSKAQAEQRVQSANADALIVRTSTLFGPWDSYNYLTRTLRRLEVGETVVAAEDWVITPTYAPDLVHAVLDLLIDGERGLWHMSHQGPVSWAEFARRGAQALGIDCSNLRGCSGEELKLLAPRPRFSALGSIRGLLLPTLDEGLHKYRDALVAHARLA